MRVRQENSRKYPYINTFRSAKMADQIEEALDMFCTARDLKEKKKVLYEDAMKSCPDQVGIETFRMLRDAEDEHLQRITDMYEEVKKGKVWVDACRLSSFESEEKQDLLRRLAHQQNMVPKACFDDVAAIQTGMDLENASIAFFEKRLPKASGDIEREFISRMIAEEREHYILLADLKYYYVDPESWFMEKSRSRLDGAGAVT
jgi:rubrerythrin